MRTFVAVEISDKKIISEIAKFQSKVKIDAKPVELHNLHFTLQFLGEISDQQVLKVKKALNNIKFSNFAINLTGIGAFPKMKFPRVVWVGTDAHGGNELVNLANQVESALSSIGFSSDKAFKPHITVFRIKNKIGDITKELERFSSWDFGSQEITNLKFKQSVLTPNGPVYTDLMEIIAEK